MSETEKGLRAELAVVHSELAASREELAAVCQENAALKAELAVKLEPKVLRAPPLRAPKRPAAKQDPLAKYVYPTPRRGERS